MSFNKLTKHLGRSKKTTKGLMISMSKEAIMWNQVIVSQLSGKMILDNLHTSFVAIEDSI